MKPALIATAIFFAALAPGLWNHGQPLPHAGARKAPVQQTQPAAPLEAMNAMEPRRASLFGFLKRSNS